VSARLEVNADEIGRFFDRLFRYADEGSYLSFRCFFEDADGVDKIRAARLDGSPALTVREAVAIAEYAANHPQRRLVFAPPVATFVNAKGATERDVANGIALSVEADAHPAASRRSWNSCSDLQPWWSPAAANGLTRRRARSSARFTCTGV
jgi:hypothetical protein